MCKPVAHTISGSWPYGLQQLHSVHVHRAHVQLSARRQRDQRLPLQEGQLLPAISQCTDEDYYAETRVMACHALHAGLLLAGQHLSLHQLRAVYPDILKRLDDSSNDVRTEACKVAIAWSMALPER